MKKKNTRRILNAEAAILLHREDSDGSAMSLDEYVKEQVAAASGDEVNFYWHGGEPLEAGLAFFAQAVWLQQKYAAGKVIHNFLETNAILLDAEWCHFFKNTDFILGVYLDGPQGFHDGYQQPVSGQMTWRETVAGIHLLNQYMIPYNIVCRVTSESVQYPAKLYRFFRNAGVKYMRFVPLIKGERIDQHILAAAGLSKERIENEHLVHWCITEKAYEEFLQKLFDCWVQKDIGWVYVLNIEGALGTWMGKGNAAQRLADICGESLVMRHSGMFLEHTYYRYPSDYLKDIGNIAAYGRKVFPTYMGLMHQLMEHRVAACKRRFSVKNNKEQAAAW